MAFTVRIVVLFWLLWTGPVAVASDRPTVAVRFRIVAFGRPHLFYRPAPAAELRQITLHTSAPSSAHRYEGPPRLALFSSDAAASPSFEVPLPTGHPRVLIVMPSGLAGDGVVNAPFVVADDLPLVPLNTVTVLNAANQTYRVEYEGSQVEVASVARASFSARPSGRLLLHVAIGERWRQVTVYDLDVEPGARAWVVLLPPYRAGQLQPRLRVIFDQGE
jgi:hypothetical protein